MLEIISMGIALLAPIPSSFPLGIKKLLIIIGIVLCLTIIGIVPGLIVLIVGFVIPTVMTKGTCPVCENTILYGNNAFNCYYCRKRILVKNNKLVEVK